MKKRILFITILLLVATVFTSTLLAESNPVGHLIDRDGDNAGGCFETATASGDSIPDNTPAGICFTADITGPTGATVTDVSVGVAAAHTWIGDLKFWLNSPDGSTIYMLARPGVAGPAGACCGDSSNLLVGSPINFEDGAPNNAETMGAALPTTDGVVCQDDGQCNFSPNPDGETSLPNFAGFAGESVTGAWEFCASDNVGQDLGNISSFTVNVTCEGGEPPVPSLVLTQTVGLDPNACATTDSITIDAGGGGTDVTYCYYMTNTGTVTFELHTVEDDQLGTVLGPDAAQTVGPNDSYWITQTVLITQTTVSSATWSATDATGGNAASASDSATVTRGTPTDVSLSSFGSDSPALSPLWLASLLAIILGFGFVLRRKMAGE